MRRLLCRWLGHHWIESREYPDFYVCSRCREPGFWVPS